MIDGYRLADVDVVDDAGARRLHHVCAEELTLALGGVLELGREVLAAGERLPEQVAVDEAGGGGARRVGEDAAHLADREVELEVAGDLLEVAHELGVEHAVLDEPVAVLEPELPRLRGVDALELAPAKDRLGHGVERHALLLVAALGGGDVHLFEDEQVIEPEPLTRLDRDLQVLGALQERGLVKPVLVPADDLLEGGELVPEVEEELALGLVRVLLEDAGDAVEHAVVLVDGDDRPAQDARLAFDGADDALAGVGLDVEVAALGLGDLRARVGEVARDRVHVALERVDAGGVLEAVADIAGAPLVAEAHAEPVALGAHRSNAPVRSEGALELLGDGVGTEIADVLGGDLRCL